MPEVANPEYGMQSQSPEHVTETEEYDPGSHAWQYDAPVAF